MEGDDPQLGGGAGGNQQLGGGGEGGNQQLSGGGDQPSDMETKQLLREAHAGLVFQEDLRKQTARRLDLPMPALNRQVSP